VLVSLAAASAFCYAYTVWLIEDASLAAFAGANLLLALFLIFCLAVTVWFSSLFKTSLAAGGLALGVIIVQGALSAVPVVGDFMPGTLLGWSTDLLNGGGEPAWWALGVTIAAVPLCAWAARRRLSVNDL
jgi:ABC-2 type transport system permease protein